MNLAWMDKGDEVYRLRISNHKYIILIAGSNIYYGVCMGMHFNTFC